QQTESLRVLSYLIQYGENIYMMIGASRPNDFNGYARIFQNSMGSFNILRDQAKINRQPERVRIKEVRQSGTLSQALKSLNVEESRMSELAILNGLRLEDPVTKGKLIKIVE